jgi:membrane-associated phospholipid phosphatase
VVPPALPPAYAHDPFLLVQHALAARWLDPVMAGATWACEGWVLALLALAVTTLPERHRPRAWLLAVPVLAALALDGALVQVLKHFLHLPRPLVVLGADAVRVVGAPLHGSSMPSGHSSAAATLAAYLFSRRHRAWPALAALALLGGLARVYVGAHWALDVAVGWLLGLLVGSAVAAAAHALAAAFATRPAPCPPAPRGPALSTPRPS